MTSPSTTITLRRERLARTIGRLAPIDAMVLLHLALRACPKTGRIWASLTRIAEDLGMPPGLVEQAITRLSEQKIIEAHPPDHGRLPWIDLDPVLVLQDDVSVNLPSSDSA